MDDIKPEKRGWTALVLLTSTGTLLCCALPILLVSLGLGTVVASMASTLPFLITLSLYKEWLFTGTAVLLGLTAWLLFRPGRACPADPELAAACDTAHRWNVRVFGLSTAIWCIGFFTAYILPLIPID